MDQDRSRRQIRVRQDVGRLLRSRTFFLIGVNALVSLVISILVVVVALRLSSGEAPGPPAVPEDVVVPAAVTQESQPPDSIVPAVEEPVTYAVKAGDTLFGIAAAYGVSLEELMRANDLTDPDFLTLGQTLIIPIPGTPLATPTLIPPDATSGGDSGSPATEAAPEPTNSPSTPTAVPQEVAVQIIAVFHSSDPEATSPVGETVIVLNRGLPVNLEDWTLSDSDGNAFTFPSVDLETGERIRVHSASGEDSETDLYWGRSSSVWDKGDTATVSDPDGEVMGTYEL
jgi:LysM repeat protein